MTQRARNKVKASILRLYRYGEIVHAKRIANDTELHYATVCAELRNLAANGELGKMPQRAGQFINYLATPPTALQTGIAKLLGIIAKLRAENARLQRDIAQLQELNEYLARQVTR